MSVTSEDKRKKQICAGILAHVDAGKTTLSECLLYIAGSIRKMGRVDTKDAFLDTNELERNRGITIFSKQAQLEWKDVAVTLLDTPGHVDFSAEMERTLQVLDAAILVISGADGVQGHTQTLWKLLKKYEIPTFLFINKMDQAGTDREIRLEELRQRLDAGCVDFSQMETEEFQEAAAMCEEAALEEFLEQGSLCEDTLRRMIAERKLFPCFFGSALKNTGVEEFLDGFAAYVSQPEYPQEFGAKVYKISRDEQGNRLTHMKITGGTLSVKSVLSGETSDGESWSEKINQIRVYSGEKYEAVNSVSAGAVCAVTGLSRTLPGDCFGIEAAGITPVLEPVLTCQIVLPDGCDPAILLPKLKMLEEEQPELHILWDEKLQEIQAQIMGEVQTEILKSLILERFGVEVSFGTANIVYKETIKEPVEGVGHFEPLRHYAEVHLLLEPLPAGSGMEFAVDCSEDLLDKNWQRLILTHLYERQYTGVLTNSELTDMRITLIAGRAHMKHTEGGDFRQATYRAVRQGLMEAESVLLEPYYEFRLEIPEQLVGRAMTDIEKMHGQFEAPFVEGGQTILTGSAPVATMQNYQQEVAAYSKGYGHLFLNVSGYAPCHNPEDVIDAVGYDPERDLENPSFSVFCAHGGGYQVPWDEVKEHMHVESPFTQARQNDPANEPERIFHSVEEQWIGTDEVDAILEKTFYANRRGKGTVSKGWKYKKNTEYTAPVNRIYQENKMQQEEYLLVDGYNVIFAWEDLNELAQINMDAARGKLMDELCNYQGMKKCNLIVVFDAYRLAGHPTEYFDYHNIHVVYTKEAETADQYIEKFAHAHASHYRVTVATSDGLEQVIIRGEGCRLLSARDLREEMTLASSQLREQYLEKQQIPKNRPFEDIDMTEKKQKQKNQQDTNNK